MPWGGEDSRMNKFEQVSSDHHQILLPGGPKVWCPGENDALPYGLFTFAEHVLGSQSMYGYLSQGWLQ